jgi:hypothetical protein
MTPPIFAIRERGRGKDPRRKENQILNSRLAIKDLGATPALFLLPVRSPLTGWQQVPVMFSSATTKKVPTMSENLHERRNDWGESPLRLAAGSLDSGVVSPSQFSLLATNIGNETTANLVTVKQQLAPFFAP